MIKLNFKRVMAIAKKEFFQIKRDPRSMALAIAIPILLLLMFGFALSLDVDNVPMGIWNQDNSQFSKNFILNFRNSRYFQIVAYSDKYPDLIHLMDQNKILMLMVIPKDFTKFISSDQTAPVQISNGPCGRSQPRRRCRVSSASTSTARSPPRWHSDIRTAASASR